MYSRSRASENHSSQKSVMFQNEISTDPLFYETHLLAVKISESCILSIQFYAGSKFCVINTISPPESQKSISRILENWQEMAYQIDQRSILCLVRSELQSSLILQCFSRVFTTVIFESIE